MELGNRTRYFVNPEDDVCLHKIPYPDEEGEEFCTHETKKHGRQFYRLYFGEDWAKFEGVEKEYIADALKDEEIKHDNCNYTRRARITGKIRNIICTFFTDERIFFNRITSGMSVGLIARFLKAR